MAHWTKPNHTFVAEYQQSCLPFVTSSVSATEVSATVATKISFPGVTRWVEVRNTGANPLRVGFTAAGVLAVGAVTGSNPIDGKHMPVLAGYAANQESQANHRNYFLLPAAASNDNPSTGRWELKCTEIFFVSNATTTGFTLVAGITTVPKDHFVIMSGSAGFRGVG
jgi:hypothetical protein